MYKKSFQAGLISITVLCKITAILAVISILSGCIGSENRADAESSALLTNGSQNISQNNLTLKYYATNTSDTRSNQLRLIIRPRELNTTGKLPVTLKIINPGLNENVLTLFKPQFGQEWYNQTSITHVTNHTWMQNFSIKLRGNISYVLMFVQISENNTVVKKAAWNITFDTPIGTAK
ncbi:MAG: hypothetical protein OIN66_17435 [Candidatus Methanoperedens sp.]|nr:hypothetical protein [Candidatus Methanoperedens sp.]